MEIIYPKDSFISYDYAPVIEARDDILDSSYNETRVLDSNSKETEAVEYGTKETMNIYREELFTVNIPEQKNDVCNKKVGATKVKVPCIKQRNVQYRIVLEVAYSSDTPKQLQKQINNCAQAAVDVACGVLASAINANPSQIPIEAYTKLTAFIPATLKSFNQSFNQCAKGNPALSGMLNKIKIAIREEKNVGSWLAEE